ncbi:MAG: hypothetical protein M3352_02285 [Bacteroidota bacterium]|nr:hypothetical protein [Bacteroidota bacterium]
MQKIIPKQAIPIRFYHRAALQESQYQYNDKRDANLPNSQAALQVLVSYLVNNELVEIRKPVLVRQANLPYGYDKLSPGIISQKSVAESAFCQTVSVSSPSIFIGSVVLLILIWYCFELSIFCVYKASVMKNIKKIGKQPFI